MRLRNKALVILASCWAAAFTVIAFVSFFILQGQFSAIEKRFIDANFDRVQTAFENKANYVARLNLDWAPWDDAYYFMQGKQPDFIKRNLSASNHNDTKIELYVFIKLDGTIYASKYFSLEKQAILPMPNGFIPLIKKGSIIFPKERDQTIEGLLPIDNKLWFVASNHVTTTDKKAEPNGILLTAMSLSQTQLDDIAKAANLPLRIIKLVDASAYPKLKTVIETTVKNGRYYIIGNKRIDAYLALKDITGKPIAIVSIEMPNDIYLQGKKTTITFLTLILFIALVISTLIIFLLRKFITNRLESMEEQITSVNLMRGGGKRIQLTGDDELNNVAASVNGMLNIIEASHKELEHRVEVRTKELEKSNKSLIKNRLKLEHMAHHDTLTGLANRALFNELLLKSMQDAKRHGQKLAVIFLDLNRFKNINDTLGHSTGDEVLVKVGSLLKKIGRTNDLLARLGGDEFVICATELKHSSDAAIIAEKIIHEFERPIFIGKRRFAITTSIGISIYPDDGDTVEKLLSNADLAMYRAKSSSNNSYQFYTSSLNQQVAKKLEIEHNLHEAINKRQIESFFQPIINLTDGSIDSVEALARWRHPEQGLIPPAEFIPIAEETGLIHALSEVILSDVLEKQTLLREKHGADIKIAVNFSAIQFCDPSFMKTIDYFINEHKLNPKKITIEITETAIMQQTSEITKKIAELKSLGFSFSIDDFGTGYSSLSYLKEFKVDYIKIDKSFLINIEESYANQNIISGIIYLAHNLGIKVVAEGVETDFALDFLREKNCDLAQGYLFSHPLPLSDFIEEFVKNPFENH